MQFGNFCLKLFYWSDNRELDYNFIFDTKEFKLRTEANFDQSTMTSTEKATYLRTIKRLELYWFQLLEQIELLAQSKLRGL